MYGLRSVAVAAAVAVSAAPTEALAGVHISPSSPAGQEYVIPLAGARSAGGSPLDASVAGTHSASVPFGVGITPPRGGTAESHRSGTTGTGTGAKTAAPRKQRSARNASRGALTVAAGQQGTGGARADHVQVSQPTSGLFSSLADQTLDLILAAALLAAIAFAAVMRRLGHGSHQENLGP